MSALLLFNSYCLLLLSLMIFFLFSSSFCQQVSEYTDFSAGSLSGASTFSAAFIKHSLTGVLKCSRCEMVRVQNFVLVKN